jgi:ParB/RepB/Spo0J family partition protein
MTIAATVKQSSASISHTKDVPVLPLGTRRAIEVPLDKIHVVSNTRTVFDETYIAELAGSIKAAGLINPLLVRPTPGAKAGVISFDLVAGECRYRACKLAGIGAVACTVREMDDKTMLEIQIIENLHRNDLNFLDEADALARLKREHGYTVEQIAAKISKSVRHVYDTIRLAGLGKAARKQVIEQNFEKSVAGLIAGIPGEPDQLGAIKDIIQCRDDGQDVSYRAVKEYVTDQYTVSLKGVPWKLEDANVYPKAGSCKDCPKRSGNLPAFDGIEGHAANVCTDTACFKMKRQRWDAVCLEAAQRLGQRVLPGKHRGGLYGSVEGIQSREVNGERFVELNARCDLDPKGRNWRDVLIKAQLPQIGYAVMQHEEDGVIELAALKDARRQAIAAGIVKAPTLRTSATRSERESPTESTQAAADRKRNAAKNKLGRKTGELAVAELCQRAVFPQQFLDCILAQRISAYLTANDYEILDRYGLSKMPARSDIATVVKLIDRLLPMQRCQLLVELRIGEAWQQWGGLKHELKDMAEFFGVDLKKLEVKAKAELDKPKPQPRGAGIIGHKLHKGLPIDWPPEANAILVRYPKGKARQLKGTESSLKGAGMPEKIQFGKVPTSGKKVQWEKFAAVQS